MAAGKDCWPPNVFGFSRLAALNEEKQPDGNTRKVKAGYFM